MNPCRLSPGGRESPEAHQRCCGGPHSQEENRGEIGKEKVQHVVPGPGIEPLLDEIDTRELLLPELVRREAPGSVAECDVDHDPGEQEEFEGASDKQKISKEFQKRFR